MARTHGYSTKGTRYYGAHNLNVKTIIVMDNATFHKNKSILKMIKDKGHIVEFLPPYSPDLNPI